MVCFAPCEPQGLCGALFCSRPVCACRVQWSGPMRIAPNDARSGPAGVNLAPSEGSGGGGSGVVPLRCRDKVGRRPAIKCRHSAACCAQFGAVGRSCVGSAALADLIHTAANKKAAGPVKACRSVGALTGRPVLAAAHRDVVTRTCGHWQQVRAAFRHIGHHRRQGQALKSTRCSSG